MLYFQTGLSLWLHNLSHWAHKNNGLEQFAFIARRAFSVLTPPSLKELFRIISLGQGDMAWMFRVFPTILPCMCSKAFHGIKIGKTNPQSIAAQQSILGFCCSVTESCLTLCDSLDYSRPGFPVLHDLPESAQIHVHWVSDAIQPHLSSPSPPAFSLS